MIPMIAPDGSLGEVPQERVDEAVQAGGKLGVWIKAPDGSHGIVPRENLIHALKAGGEVLRNDPTQPPEEKLTLGSAAKAAAQGVGDVLEGIGRGAIGLVKTPYEIAKAAATPPQTTAEGAAAAIGPPGLVAKRLILDPMNQLADQARKETGVKKVAMAAMSGVPLAGPMIANFANQIQRPEDIAKAAGEALALKEVPTVVGKVAEEAKAVQPYLKERNLRLGEQGIKDVAKASGKNLGFGEDLKLSIPELQKIQKEQPLEAGGNMKVRELVEKLDKRLDEKWNADHVQVINRNPNVPVDEAAIVKAGADKLTPGSIRADPAGAKSAQKWLDEQVNKPMDVKTADEFRHGLHVKTKASFGQDSPIEMEVKKAVLSETRKQIDKSLIDAGEESITQANRSWGALSNIRDVLESRMNAAERMPSRSGMALGAITGFAGKTIKRNFVGAVLSLRDLIKVAKGGPGEQLETALDRLVRAGEVPKSPPSQAPDLLEKSRSKLRGKE